MPLLSSDTVLAARLLVDGDIAAALQAAQRGLQAEPDNAPLWNLLGVCAGRLQQDGLAEQCWQQALRLDAATPDAHYNLGCLYAAQGRSQAAEQHYRAELAGQPRHVSCLGNLGVLLENTARGAEAEACYRQALARDEDCGWVWFNLGRQLQAAGRRDEALPCLRRSLALQPDDVETLQVLGQLLVALGQAPEAERLLRRALALAPGHLAALNNLGLLLQERRQWDEAEACLRQAWAQDAAAVLPNLAALLSATSRSAEAEALLRPALRLRPDDPELLNLLGVLLQDQGQYAAAEQCWRHGLAQAPTHRRLRQHLAYLQLARGEYAAGWARHEARLEAGHYPQPGSPRWQGEDLRGRHLLLIFEQGYGDAIQFFRYLPQLLARRPAKITAMCRQPLLALFAAQGLAVAWLPILRRNPDFPPHDCHLFAMSLPLHLQPVPQPLAAYLQADAARCAYWRERLPPGRKLGLVWHGHVAHPFDHCRSLPDADLLQPLLGLAGVSLLSVQPEPSTAERGWAQRHGVLELGSQLGDFADSAALLSQLELLISVDTASAHLAGALGVPCCLLLSCEHTDWRWGLQGETTPWYPSLRLVRQRRGESWDAVIRRLPVE